MSYCKTGEKVVIKYKFPEKKEITYTTKNSPVEISVQTITAKHYVLTGYYCEYWVDQCDQLTGKVLQSGRYFDYGPQYSDGTLISPNTKIVYPPFKYPITEWLDLFYQPSQNYCDHQVYRQGIEFSDSAGKRKMAYFNFFGWSSRASRQNSNCYYPFVPRDITFRRVDSKQDPLKWEINIVDNKGNSFTDYGLGQPTYICQCGDCPDGLRCDSSIYPGYKCIPCSSLKSEIAAMRSIIRGING